MNILLAAWLLLVPAPDRAELKAKPGGSVRFDYGAPRWQDAFEEQITEGLSWRLSASAENRLTTKAALLFEEAVVFPGTYNVGALCRAEPDWDLVFHHDGIHYGNGPHAGMFSLEATRLPTDEATEKLEISFSRDDDAYRFDIRFGSRALSTPFQTAAVKTVRGKVGKYGFTSSYLVREDLQEVATRLDEDEITLARIESKHLEHPVRVRLRDGGMVEVVLEREDPRRADLFIEGTSHPLKRPTKAVGHTVSSGAKAAVMAFQIGATEYRFELPERVFRDSVIGK